MCKTMYTGYYSIRPGLSHQNLASSQAKSSLTNWPAISPKEQPCPAFDVSDINGINRRAKRRSYRDLLDQSILALPRTSDCFMQIEEDPKLDLKLPARKNALPGFVLKHCYQVLDAHIERKKPMMFKIGFTHSAFCRWHNAKFGYGWDKSKKWDGLIVVYASAESISASFVEAAMIQRFMGNLACSYHVLQQTPLR